MLFPSRFLGSMGAGLGFTDSMKEDIEAMADILPRANAAGVRLVLGDDLRRAFPSRELASDLFPRLLRRLACARREQIARAREAGLGAVMVAPMLAGLANRLENANV